MHFEIFSWGSGANAWGDERDEKFTKPNHWDGMLEVVGVTGVVHLGQIQSGLRSAIRIVQVLITYSRVFLHRKKISWQEFKINILFVVFQGSHIKIKTNTEIPVQVDGEPWLQPPGDIVVLKSALKVRSLILLDG